MKRLLDTNAYVELLKGNADVAGLVRSAEALDAMAESAGSGAWVSLPR